MSGADKEFFMLVDVADADWVRGYSWCRNHGGLVYARVNYKLVGLHRAIWERHHPLLLPGEYIEHKGRDQTDNRLENLRKPKNRNANSRNVDKRSGDFTSEFKGVQNHREDGWRAMIATGLGHIHLYCSPHEHHCAFAYNVAALEIDAEHFKINDDVPEISPEDKEIIRAAVLDKLEAHYLTHRARISADGQVTTSIIRRGEVLDATMTFFSKTFDIGTFAVKRHALYSCAYAQFCLAYDNLDSMPLVSINEQITSSLRLCVLNVLLKQELI